MVEISKERDHIIFEVLGFHKVLALKSRIEIPAGHVVDAYRNETKLGFFIGYRMPGTHIPGLITAGTFYGKSGKTFIDVVDHKQSIVVELQQESYKKLIIEVKDPEKSLRLLSKK
jgi:hypothetical protein